MLKKITLLFCCNLFIFSFNLYAQQTIDVNLKNESLESFIKTIETKTAYTFMFDNSLDLSEKIDVNLQNASIQTILNNVFKNKEIAYEISGTQIILKKKELALDAPKQKVTGNITDEEGNPLVGVIITAKGGSDGTVTDIDGNFEFMFPKGALLTFSYVGFIQQTATATSSPLKILLKEDNKQLREVVVIGYGSMEKRAVTSSITSLGGKDLVQGIGGASIATALQGKISGLVISGNSSPNSANDFQLRGVGSINAAQQPLIVIDGIPGGDIRSVNQEDILSIDVLKDASAGAIYGTRAAAGVILITTRQGQINGDGNIKLTYTGEFTTESIRKRPEVLSADEYREYKRGNEYNSNTDWYDELVNKLPFSHRQVFNLSGGTKYSNVYATFTTQDQEGIVINDSRKDYSARLNANFKLLDNFLEIKTHAAYRQANRIDHKPNFNQAIKANPTRPVYDPNTHNGTGYNIWLGGWEDFNALAESNLRNNGGTDKWLNGDVTLKLNLTPELSVQGTMGYQNRQWNFHEYTSRWTKEMQQAERTGKGKLGIDKRDDVSFDAYANYIKEFNGHTINATAGYSFFETNREKWNMTNFNFPVDALDVWDMGSGTFLSDGEAEMESNKEARERLLAFFGRLNYAFNDKYMFSASLRHEGSSKFGKNNRWGNFWSISGGWRVSKENFMKDLTFINDLKLRIGYGITGNNGFESGNSTLMYSSDQWWLINNEWIKTFGSKHNVNPDLKWEEKREVNFGIDYSFLNNRIYGKLDIYRRKDVGMLYKISVPQPPYVHKDMMANAGDLENKGWEFEIGGDIVKGSEFNYSSTIRFSNNQTKILSLWGSNTFENRKGFPGPGSPGDAIRLEAGSTIGKFYLWRYAGIDKDGNWQLYDKNNNIIAAKDKKEEDKAYVGNSMPKAIISWDHTIGYKNWDFSIFFRSWIDFDVYNAIDMYYGLSNVTEINVLKDAYHRYSHIKGEKELSDFWLQDGTFLKIDAINIGYKMNLKKYSKHLDNARFYLTVRDVATFTKYKGLDPEVKITGLEPGFEMPNDIYPQTRRYTFGIQLTF